MAAALRLTLRHPRFWAPAARATGAPRLPGSLQLSAPPLRAAAAEDSAPTAQEVGKAAAGFTVVMKFGGSSLASAERIREVADLILSFPDETPVIVLSAMGRTTNNLLLAGEKAVSCGAPKTSEIPELLLIKELHLRTIDELGLDRSTVSGLLDELQQLLKGIAMMKQLTPRTRDYLVSFGERMSTRIFAAYLNKLGEKARQYDAFDIGFIATDDFTNADILEATYPAVARRLQQDWTDDPAIPVVTGFLGKGWKSCAFTTLGRGGSDLTAITIGKALGIREIQVWRDVDGVLTCDPNICANAIPVPYLTFDEAAELAYFGAQVLHPQSMRPASEGGIQVRIKNMYNRHAPGTVITKARDMSKSILTSIVLKSNVTMLDIASTQMLGGYAFLAKISSILEASGISVDFVATGELSISLVLNPPESWSPEFIKQECDRVVEEHGKIAAVCLQQQRSIISLIGNVQRSSLIHEMAFHVLGQSGVDVQMIPQGASKVNISLVVHDSEAKQCVQALHSAFFEDRFLSEVEGAAAVHGPNAAAAAAASASAAAAADSSSGDDNSGNPTRPILPFPPRVAVPRQRGRASRSESSDIEAAIFIDEDQERNRVRRDGWRRLRALGVLVTVYRTCFVVLWWLLEKMIKEKGVLVWSKPAVWLVCTIIYWLLKKLLNRRYRVTPKEDYYFCVHAVAYCIFRGLVDTKIGSQGLLIPLIVAHIVSFSVDLLGAVFIAFFCDAVGDIGDADMS
ncbi:hypothetical protein ACP70R_023663 [Stipagrostis hirtigluma subsp. patula]